MQEIELSNHTMVPGANGAPDKTNRLSEPRSVRFLKDCTFSTNGAFKAKVAKKGEVERVLPYIAAALVSSGKAEFVTPYDGEDLQLRKQAHASYREQIEKLQTENKELLSAATDVKNSTKK